jgi:hypothetical protein
MRAKTPGAQLTHAITATARLIRQVSESEDRAIKEPPKDSIAAVVFQLQANNHLLANALAEFREHVSSSYPPSRFRADLPDGYGTSC